MIRSESVHTSQTAHCKPQRRRRAQKAWTLGRRRICEFWFNEDVCLGYSECCLCSTELDRKKGELTLVFDNRALILRGPGVHRFHELYVRNRVTSVRADGQDILSIGLERTPPLVLLDRGNEDPADWWRKEEGK